MTIPFTSERRRSKPLTGRAVLAILLTFFAVIGSVNATMIHFALSTFRGTVGEHPYEDGLQFNNDIAASRAQAARRWSVEAHVASNGDRRRIEVVARDAEGRALPGLSIRAQLAAPVDSQLDREVLLSEQPGGLYVGEIAAAKGRWDLDLTAGSQGETLFRSRGRINIE